jgi:hypothetical protein
MAVHLVWTVFRSKTSGHEASRASATNLRSNSNAAPIGRCRCATATELVLAGDSTNFVSSYRIAYDLENLSSSSMSALARAQLEQTQVEETEEGSINVVH